MSVDARHNSSAQGSRRLRKALPEVVLAVVLLLAAVFLLDQYGSAGATADRSLRDQAVHAGVVKHLKDVIDSSGKLAPALQTQASAALVAKLLKDCESAVTALRNHGAIAQARQIADLTSKVQLASEEIGWGSQPPSQVTALPQVSTSSQARGSEGGQGIQKALDTREAQGVAEAVKPWSAHPSLKKLQDGVFQLINDEQREADKAASAARAAESSQVLVLLVSAVVSVVLLVWRLGVVIQRGQTVRELAARGRSWAAGRREPSVTQGHKADHPPEAPVAKPGNTGSTSKTLPLPSGNSHEFPRVDGHQGPEGIEEPRKRGPDEVENYVPEPKPPDALPLDESADRLDARSLRLGTTTSGHAGMTFDLGRQAGLWLHAGSVIGPEHRSARDQVPREDAYGMSPGDDASVVVAAVADGVGSTRHAHVASQLAVEAALRTVRTFGGAQVGTWFDRPSEWRSVAANVMEKISPFVGPTRVAERVSGGGPAGPENLSGRRRSSPATTLVVTVAAMQGDCARVLWCSVGDSRVAVLRPDVPDVMWPADTADGRQGTRALPADSHHVDSGHYLLEPGHAILLVTDGCEAVLGLDPQARALLRQLIDKPCDPGPLLQVLNHFPRGANDDRTMIMITNGSAR